MLFWARRLVVLASAGWICPFGVLIAFVRANTCSETVGSGIHVFGVFTRG